MRFRHGPVAVAADIEAMFLQVGVPPEDQRALRFLWREDPSEDVMVYQYTRHIFGAKSSPTCANYAVQRTARDNEAEFSKAAETVLKDFYMDDLLKSVKTQLEAVNLCKDLMKMLARGGFNLTKWTSNSVTVLEQLECGDAAAEFQLSGPPDLHVLGVKWCVRDDSLVVSRGTMRSVSHDCTQREILSLVSSVFDPIGVVAPFTIRSRLILKAIWQTHGHG